MQGTRLGPYEILERLGAGGMGEVWLAQDSRLGRKVAIKVLPPEFAGDPERLARFELEARAAAALNHPHIAAVHDIGQDGGVHYIVQEHLEGEPLRAALEKGPLALKRALALAAEIAEALAAAHAAGIVHRDLKPENIFVSKDGHAKVLDFGLAKLTQSGGAFDASMSPTALGTVAGQVLGTAGYMSPEQIRGAADLDARADLFAFGCVLYEMAAGRRAFTGKNVHDVLNKLLSTTPVPASSVREGLPPRLDWILEKALAKDPADRYQTAGDAVVDLRAVAGTLEGTTSQMSRSGVATAGSTAAAQPTRAGVSFAVAILGALAALALGAAVGAAWFGSAPAPAGARVAHVEVDVGTGLNSTYNRAIAVTPDGDAIGLTTSEGFWYRRVGERRSRILAGTEKGIREPFFSPDSRLAGYWADGRIKWVPIDGSGPVTAGPVVDRPVGTSWGVDGRIYVGQASNGIWRVDPAGGEPEQVAAVEPPQLANGPELLPGGEWLVFTVARGMSRWDEADIVAQSLRSGERRVLIQGGREPRYVASGHLLYVRGGVLHAVAFDAADPAVTGTAVPMVDGIPSGDYDITGTAWYDVGDDGTLVYLEGNSLTSGSRERKLAWIAADGPREDLPIAPQRFNSLTLSGDERRIAADIADPAGGAQIWVFDVDRPTGFRLTSGSVNRNPVWGPGDEFVYFASDSGGDFDIWRRRVDMSAPVELVYAAPGDQVPSAITADGARMIFTQLSPSNSDIWQLSLSGDPAPVALAAGAGDEVWPSLSSDGRYVAYQAQESGEWSVHASEIASGRRTPIAANAWGPAWSPDGSRIFFNFQGGAELRYVDVARLDPLELGPRAERFTGTSVVGLAVPSRDGRRVLMQIDLDEGTTRSALTVQVVLNWFTELRQRAPAGR